MKTRRFLKQIALCLSVALLAWQSAAAEEALYETGKYLEGCCDVPSCEVPCGGCGDACCGSCCCSTCSGWYAGAEAFWAQPRIKDNNAYSLLTRDISTSNTVTVPYEYDYDVTPRIWVGYMDCCGSGFRASWWKYEDDADPVAATIPPDGGLMSRVMPNAEGMFSGEQQLELELADIELTNAFDLCGGCALVSYGVRYVRYASDTREQVVTTISRVTGSVLDKFDGVGPTLALEFNRPVNCRWSVYGKMRGTIAMGERDTSANLALLNAGGSPVRLETVSRSGQEAFAIAELQIGLQWNYCCWFVRGGWQAQYWDDAMEVAPVGTRGGGGGGGTLGDIGVHGFNIAVGYAR